MSLPTEIADAWGAVTAFYVEARTLVDDPVRNMHELRAALESLAEAAAATESLVDAELAART